jgi:hypothetical protein
MRYDPLQSFGWWVSHNGPLLKPFERMRSGTPVTNPHRNLLPRIHLRHRFKQVQPPPPHTHTHNSPYVLFGSYIMSNNNSF